MTLTRSTLVALALASAANGCASDIASDAESAEAVEGSANNLSAEPYDIITEDPFRGLAPTIRYYAYNALFEVRSRRIPH